MDVMRDLRLGAIGLVVAALAACQATGSGPAPQAAGALPTKVERLSLDVPEAWGGEVRCAAATGCRLVAVEHETSKVVLHQLEPGRTARLLDKQTVAYHPDSAVWLSDDLVVAAVEISSSLDVFRVEGERLRRVDQIPVNMQPRDVVVVSAQEGRYRMLATPYSGTEVVWVDYAPGDPGATRVTRRKWCEAPWHPERVSRAPGAASGGLAVACLDEKRVLFVPDHDLLGEPQTLVKLPGELSIVPRRAKASPSGRWLYVALETGYRNLRVDMDSGAFQWVVSPLVGAVSALPLSDDLVVWGDDAQLFMQRLGPQGEVLETRWLPVGGFATQLQLQDVDGDGEPDLIVLNSASAREKKTGVEVIYGPLWERAQTAALKAG